MCGLAGYFGPLMLASDKIRACLRLMHRRGPDHSTWRRWTNGAGNHIYLLFTRLSIIDRDARANQPLNVGSKWIVLNGELYNYIELRSELMECGRNFTTQSDTEVLLTAIDCFGWSAIDQCEGMWAFVVYDQIDGSLTLCRDRFGEKPLYIYRDGTGIFFGSEVKFIMALLGRRLGVNLSHVFRYMVNGYKALYKNGQTFFNGLAELAPASILCLDSSGQEESYIYWQPKYAPDEAMPYEAAVSGSRDRLIRSMELRLRADVPLAFCMSGGIDSNSLVSIAKRILDYDVHGFTIVSKDKRYEEQDMVKNVVKELSICHTAIPVKTDEFLFKLRQLVIHHDAPVYTISYFAHWLLVESIAAHGYRVSMSGTGADELFTGYYDHHLAYFHEVQDDPALLYNAQQVWYLKIRPLVRNPYLSDPNRFIDNPSFRDHIFLDADFFASFLKLQWREQFSERKFTESLLRNRMLNELFYESIPVILHEDDLNAMYFSIENRSPFLDRGLFEFCYSIPSRHLIQDGLAKAVLRDAMRGIVPEKILNNPHKVGFNVPIFSFLNVQDPTVHESLLDDSPIFDHVRREKIEVLLKKPFLPNSESKFLFYFLNSKIFLEEFGT